MSELPYGWTESPLVELISEDGLFSDGDWVESKDQDPNGAIRLLQLADIGDGKFLNKSNRYVNDEKFELLNCTEILEGDVLVARMPDPLGRACLMPKLPQKCITVVDVAIIRPGTESVSTNWLMHFLNSPEVRQEMQLLSSGSTRKRISRGNLSQIVLPVPPPNEQKRIAEKLDSLLTRVDSCERHLERVPQILKRFRQSVLAAATSGRLTEDWREEKGRQNETRQISFDEDWIDIPSHWEDFELYDIIDPERPLCYGVVQPGDEVDNGVLLVRVLDLENWKIKADGLRTISPDIDASYRRSRVKAGDLLLSVVGTIGRTAIVPEGLEANIARAIARISCREGVNPRWANIWLSCNTVQWWLSKSAREVARKTLNLSELGTARIALPSPEEQTEIVRRVESLFAYAERLEARYLSASERVARLTPSLLAKGFRGELV